MKSVEQQGLISPYEKKEAIIYPIVLYTGKRTWNTPKSLYETQQEELINTDIFMDLEYALVDVNKYKNEDLIKERSAISKAMLMEKMKSREKLIEVLEKLTKEPLTKEEKEFIVEIVECSAKDIIAEEKAIELSKKIMKKEEKIMVVENVRKLLWEEPYNDGVSQGIKKVIINMLKSKMSDKTIKKVTNISDKELNEIKDEINA
jgi:hypothetical protein